MIYAIAKKVPERNTGVIEAGKAYKVLGEELGGLFHIQCDLFSQRTGENVIIDCLWEGCAHLDGENWTRVEIRIREEIEDDS